MAKQLTLEQFEGLEEMFVDVDSSIREIDNKTEAVPAGSREHILNLQLVMATTSVNHEYARVEYEESSDIERKEELLRYMTECREKYDGAREELACFNPLVLETFESELAMQKRSTMVHYHA
ncbi:MAG: hypothetical protein HYT75_04430 [Deltaproteobacteria bacterium]|nr:hypothetical protein [Deltaproteobacteria bacterium]